MDFRIVPAVIDTHHVTFFDAVPFGSVVLSSLDVNGAWVAKAPFRLGSNGITEFNARVEIDGQFFSTTLDHDVDGEVHVVADHHVNVHVGAHQLIVAGEVLRVENVNRQHVFGLGDDVDVKSSGVATKGGLGPIGHDNGVGEKAVSEDDIAGSTPNLDIIALDVLNRLWRNVLGLVNVDV